MYRKILLALEHTESDKVLLEYIPPLASIAKSELLLLHVAEGVPQNVRRLLLVPSKEMRDDWDYLERTASHLRTYDLRVNNWLALGSPPGQIIKVADQERCDLIAMVSHGHRIFGNILDGSNIDAVRHGSRVPVLVIPSMKAAP